MNSAVDAWEEFILKLFVDVWEEFISQVIYRCFTGRSLFLKLFVDAWEEFYNDFWCCKCCRVYMST